MSFINEDLYLRSNTVYVQRMDVLLGTDFSGTSYSNI